jgi:hypothetical protein
MATDLELNEVRCSECGKPVPSIPQWLSDVKVAFQCEECRQKHPRAPGVPELVEPPRRTLGPTDEGAEIEEVVDESIEDLDDEAEEEEEEEEAEEAV